MIGLLYFVLAVLTSPFLNRLYTEDPAGGSNEVSWSRFQRILREAGFPRGVKPMSALKLDPAMAEIIDRFER